MNKEFIPYQESLELKELGFDEPCFGWYSDKNIRISGMSGCFVNKPIKNSSFTEDDEFVSAPLYQQAFRWFREKKLSDACICRYQSRDDGGAYYYYVINHDFGIEETKHFKEGFNTYEEAELACLRKLIELVKQKP